MKKKANSIHFQNFPKSNLDLEWTLAIFSGFLIHSLFWFNTEIMFISTNFTSIFLKLMYNIIITIWIPDGLNPFEMLL
jgi:hypothetical protein